MATPPWVRYFSDPTPGIGSTPTLICVKENAYIPRAIIVTNTNNQDIFVTVTRLQERLVNNVLTPLPSYECINVPVKAFERIDLIAGMAPLYEAGDSLFAYSDFAGNLFDCLTCGEELLELPS